MSIDKDKERMIGEMVNRKNQMVNDFDESIKMIDNADTPEELIKALIGSPLMVNGVKRLHSDLGGMKDVLNSIQKMDGVEVEVHKIDIGGKGKSTTESEVIPPKPQFNEKTLQYAYDMGFDSAMNGSNTINCHFALFKSNNSLRAWEQGNEKGKETKNASKRNI